MCLSISPLICFSFLKNPVRAKGIRRQWGHCVKRRRMMLEEKEFGKEEEEGDGGGHRFSSRWRFPGRTRGSFPVRRTRYISGGDSVSLFQAKGVARKMKKWLVADLCANPPQHDSLLPRRPARKWIILMIKVDYLALLVFDRENLLQLLWGRRESRRSVIDLSLKEDLCGRQWDEINLVPL